MSEEELENVNISLVKSLTKNKIKAFNLNEQSTEPKRWISTGSTLLDYAISNKKNGGVPEGKISEISGLESTGKSLLAFHIIKNTQKMGGIAVLIDAEHSLSKDFMERQGVNPKRCVYVQPDTLEEGFEAIENVIIKVRERPEEKDIPFTIVYDSIAAAQTADEIEGSYDPNERIGVKAKALSKALRKITSLVGHEKVTLVCINQLREKVGVLWGDKWTTPGGHAMNFHASVRVRLEKVGGKVKIDDEIVGEGIKATVTKSRFGPNFRTAKFVNYYDFGPDDEGSWYDFLHEKGDIKKSAGWSKLTLDGEEICFRHGDWKRKLQKEPRLKKWTEDLLEKYLVKEYKKPEDIIDLSDSIVEEGKE